MADQEWQKRLNDSGYKNWMKVSLALIESKEALHDFIQKVILTVHNRIKTKLGSGVCDTTCNTNKGAPSCPSCSQWVNEIRAISGGVLHWKNADPRNWHNVPWEVAKCFMNAQGSKVTAAANTGPEKTDLSGILNVLINCKEFKLNHLKEKKLAENVRTVRNELMHCATMSFKDAEMQSKVDSIIALLEDEKELKNLSICQEKVKLIKSLKDSEFQLKPEHEELCIDTALKSPELSVEPGVEIDEDTRPLFDKLIELVKANKDLEKKFEDKVNKIDEKLKNFKEETDARFSGFDVNLGDLKGTVESLVSRIEKLESGTPSSSPRSVLGAHENSLFKNALQSYTQKKKLNLPKYDYTKGVDGMYLGMVFVQGQKFESKEPKASKKGAEQSAAEVALRFLGSMDLEDDNDHNKPSSTVLQAMGGKSTQQRGKNYKNLLQEKAQMQRILLPIYDVEQEESGFLCKVMYDGRWYSPEMTPQSRKIDAQQKAAQFVLAVLDRPDESNSDSERMSVTESDEISAECKPHESSMDEATNSTHKIERSPTGSLPVTDRPDGKTYKSLLNEYAQKMGEKSPEYEEMPAADQNSKEFRSKVKILEKTFVCVEAYSSKKRSREMAAMEAMKYFDGLSSQSSSESMNAPVSAEEEQVEAEIVGTSRIEKTVACESPRSTCVKSNEISTDSTTGQASQISSTFSGNASETLARDGELSCENEGSSDTETSTQEGATPPTSNRSAPAMDRTDGKTYKSRLNEYAQKMGKKSPEYEEIPSTDQNNKEFRSKVKILDKTFECVGAYSSKKLSREMAAMEALKDFGVLSAESSTNSNNDITSTMCEFPSNNSTVTSEAGLCASRTRLSSKQALHEYLQKRKFDEELRYVQVPQDPKTKLYLSKVFLGRRCFKGKQGKVRLKEAENHVAEIVLDTLEGRSDKPDRSYEELLNSCHKDFGLPKFPKYEDATCNDDGTFSVCVQVLKKYKIVCDDGKPTKKKAEMWLAEKAVKDLEEEKRMIPAHGNAKSGLNVFLQSQGTHAKLQYDVQGDQTAGFSGCLYFFAVDKYESLAPQPSKEEAVTSAAMSACNGMDLI